MWVTIYTDASFTQNVGGAWAVWLRCEKGREIRNGVCPPEITDANQAEMYAIIQGVRIALERWAPITGALVRTDSQTAVGCLKYGARSHRRSDYRVLQNNLREILAPDTRIRMTWVPGHQRPNNVRAWLNDRVDQLAREARRSPCAHTVEFKT